ncbi:MAG: DUF2817 domain-containing protein [Sandaracinaceae bacterium]|nr:DUF2817 domain-containing protein [Sandaracinaceae bacterium]
MSFPELDELFVVLDALGPWARPTVRGHVDVDGQRVPLLDITLGATDPSAPTLALIGGVHGLERIGAQVVLAELQSLAARLVWDRTLRRELEHVRVATFPIVNPWGMLHSTRSNARGVDLMRNAPPVDPRQRATPLVGGQTLSSQLPWFAGDQAPDAMELPRAQALCAFVREHVFPASCAVTLDAHSGLWSARPPVVPVRLHARAVPGLPETAALAALLDVSLPHHVYAIEPQAQAYTIRGDLWDHLYAERLARTDLPPGRLSRSRSRWARGPGCARTRGSWSRTATEAFTPWPRIASSARCVATCRCSSSCGARCRAPMPGCPPVPSSASAR